MTTFAEENKKNCKFRGADREMPSDKVNHIKQRIKAQKKQMEEDNELFEQLYHQETGYLETQENEKPYNIKQNQIKEHLDDEALAKLVNLELDHGPYRSNYSRNGSHLILGGLNGQIATLDWRNGKVFSDIMVDDQVHDVTYLQNQLFYAVAQSKFVYMYDQNGAELHCLEHHKNPTRLEYLPYHFLLASCSNIGLLSYTDVSIGTNVSKHRSKMGQCQAMGLNKHTGIVSLGHYNGTVTFWQPSMGDYAMKMLCHKNKINDICFDVSGNYMFTAGNDQQVKVFDLRKMEQLYSYSTSGLPTSIDMSGNNVLSIAMNSRVQCWKSPHLSKEKSPYMQHIQHSSTVNCVKFVPHEDLLGFGHQNGYSTMAVPGSGASYDALEANPFETVKQRREKEVKDLLDKLPPETIQLKSIDIGKVSNEPFEKETKEIMSKRKKTLDGKKWSNYKDKRIADTKTKEYRESIENQVPTKRAADVLDRFKGHLK